MTPEGLVEIENAERSLTPARLQPIMADAKPTRIGTKRWFKEMEEMNTNIQTNIMFFYSDRGLTLSARLYPQVLTRIANAAHSNLSAR
jgi:hypothetical protein